MNNKGTKSTTENIPIEVNIPKDAITTASDSQRLLQEREDTESQQSLDNWYYLVISYLSIAKLAIIELQEKGLDDNRNLVIPAFYNLKHTIEIVLKYFCISNGKKYDLSHDIEKLVKEFRSSKKIKRKENPKEFDTFKDLITLAKKYANLEFITGKLGLFQIKDGSNDFFRYPDGNAVIKVLDYSAFVLNIDDLDIKNVFEDILLLEEAIELLKKYFNTEDMN